MRKALLLARRRNLHRALASTKSTWTRERPFTRSRQVYATEAGTGVVNNMKDADPSNYRAAIKSVDKNNWEVVTQEELQALENNQVWKMVEHDLLVTATDPLQVEMFFSDYETLSVKNLGNAHKFLGMRINYNDEDGYDIYQEVAIVDMLKELGLENARGTRTHIEDTTNDIVKNDVGLPVCTTAGGVH
uniref:AlNc14C197G8584 protein n=1 Tax=Albugo laibachii Nc14 TaxID=890382 RepID=F0WQA3_9STRA|nr:AlNc14C197G8584 [Albugo laibachii Nc14]|eukprot:CCA23511.1 AlNc14C197G8584 [Albugo laibachii Nc14]